LADVKGLQLLPETRKKIEVVMPGENRWLYSGIIFLILCASIVGGLYFYSSSLSAKIAEIDSQLAAMEGDRDSAFEREVLTLNKQLALISQLAGNHIYWTKSLDKLETLAVDQVQLTSLKMESDGKIALSALAGNYSALARQIASLTASDAVTDIDLGTIKGRTDGKLEFNLSILIDKSRMILNGQSR